MKTFAQKILSIYVNSILFPLSRWHRSNLFLYLKKDRDLTEKPSLLWLIICWPYRRFINAREIVKLLYEEAIIKNYTRLLKKHYLENYAYNKDLLADKNYQDVFMARQGSMAELFKNKFFLNILDIKNGDFFMDCGCGEGLNIKETLSYFPGSKVTAFDISQNAVDFANKLFKDKGAVIFQGSVTDLSVLKKYPGNSIDHVFFANILPTLLADSIAKTRQLRQDILNEAIRIAKKNVILNETKTETKHIRIEQKYRAHFYEDFSSHFKTATGNIICAPRFIIFHKG